MKNIKKYNKLKMKKIILVSFLALGLVVVAGVALAACSDTDGTGVSKNYNLKGSLNYNGATLTDFCIDSTTLNEYFCSGAEFYACPSGCSNGACVVAGSTENVSLNPYRATDFYKSVSAVSTDDYTPIQGAKVNVFDYTTKKLVATCTTASDGKCSVSLVQGAKYYDEISMLGYANSSSAGSFIPTKSQESEQIISLVANTVTLTNTAPIPKARFKMNEGSYQFLSDSVSGYDSSVLGVLGGSNSVDSSDPTWASSCKEGAYCLSFDGVNDKVVLSNLPVNLTTGSSNTVAFWMYWKGKDQVMPFGWNGIYDLWIKGNCFGFNTGGSNIEGICSVDFLKNSWHYVTAVFPSGVVITPTTADLWIDGAKQTIKHQFGYTASVRYITNKALLSGWGYSSSYKFDGMLDDFQLFDYRLTDSEAQALYQAAKVALAPQPDTQTQVQAQSFNQTLTEQIANISEFVSALSDRIKELLGK
ncbi:hypothetical protein L6252_02900 [Candidatus Parcubacteria bacterium]|nr:hypothetical protein [Candidatus Parcubacteria bacterium]